MELGRLSAAHQRFTAAVGGRVQLAALYTVMPFVGDIFAQLKAATDTTVLQEIRDGQVTGVTGGELLELIRKARTFLAAKGLKKGDRCGLLAANSIRFELNCPEIAEAPLRVGLADQAGWLTSRIIDPGWTARLSDIPRQALADALTGLYKMSGVELVHEQIAANIDPQQSFAITDRGLTVWSGSGTPLHAYDLRDDRSSAESASSLAIIRPEPFDREALVFASWPVPWDLWVEVWDRDQAGGRYTPRLVVGAHLLPQSLERAVS